MSNPVIIIKCMQSMLDKSPGEYFRKFSFFISSSLKPVVFRRLSFKSFLVVMAGFENGEGRGERKN